MANFDVLTDTNTGLVEGLKPGTTYTAQVAVFAYRSPDGSRISEPWSTSFTFTTITDQTAPATPSNFQLELDGETFVATWDRPTLNEDASPISNDFKNYILEFYPPGSPELAQQYYLFYEEEKFELPLPLNRLLFGTPQGQLTFTIRSLDLSGNESSPTSLTAGGSPLPAPVLELNTDSDSALTIGLKWDNNTDASYYTIHRAAGNGDFTADATNFVSSVTASRDSNITHLYYYDVPDSNQEFSYKVIGYNVFGTGTTSTGFISSQTESPLGDSPITETPGTFTVVGGTHSFTLTHTVEVSPGVEMSPRPRYFDVYASSTSPVDTTEGSADYVGRMNVPSAGPAEETFVWVVATTPAGHDETEPAPEPLFVKVRAANNAAGLSPESPEVQASPGVSGAGMDYFEKLAITDAFIQDLSASKIIANTAFTNNLTVESIFTLQNGGVMKSSNYIANTQGWYLDSAGVMDLNDLTLRGHLEATSGYLDTINVRNTLTVGDGAVAGSVQSSNYSPGSAGWAIKSDGSSEFRSGTFRGTIEGLNGYLQSLNVNGTITVSSGSGSIRHSSGLFYLNANGTASFASTVSISGSLSVTGSLSIQGVSNLYNALYIQSGGKIRVGSTNVHAEMGGATSNGITFNYYGNLWKLYPSPEQNMVFSASSFGDGFAFEASGGERLLRFQSGYTHGFLDAQSGTSNRLTLYSADTGTPRINFNGSANQLQIESSTGSDYYVFSSTSFTPTTGHRNLGTGSQDWGQVYAQNTTIYVSDLRAKKDIAKTRYGLDFINKLEPIEYRWIDSDSNRIHHGLIAQSVLETISEFGGDSSTFAGYIDYTVNPVDESDVEAAPGQPRLGLRYSEFISPMIQAIKELSDKIDYLDYRLDQLESA